MSLTPAQEKAVKARGNVLVVAGAGTGKTSTLVERCLDCLFTEKPHASIDEILMVTFTEAAATEMRKRIRDRLDQESLKPGGDNRWQEELALFESAHFGTLHSFCLHLVRQHFYQLELDPQLTVMPEEEARILADETLDNLLREHYADTSEPAMAVQRLIQTQARGWDRPIRSLVLHLYNYAQTLPDPGRWIEDQLAALAEAEPLTWRRWLVEAVAELPKDWLDKLQALGPENEVAARCAETLRALGKEGCPRDIATLLREVNEAREDCADGKKGSWLKPLEPLFKELEFLGSLQGEPGGSDPLAEDWSWTREHMTALVKLVREFSGAYAETKRELGVLDFHDLEQYALRLLWDSAAGQPTAIALEWRRKLRFIFVDEYQDINAVQDRIIQALAREGAEANRFLVGDVKQSIYRFRLANPRIFQAYAEHWTTGNNQVLPLLDNFRSREPLLLFANSLFGQLMTSDLGGVDYVGEAALRFGAPRERTEVSAAALGRPAVELHFLLKASGDAPEADDEDSEALTEVVDLQQAEREARLAGLQLRRLHAARHPVWDARDRKFRPVEWKDMAILLRSPSGKAESFAREFARLNLPLQVERGAFYRSLEISDLLSLLQLLDNPLQDLPLLGVLHSPLVGLNANELAEIRLAARKMPFWTALARWHRSMDATTQGEKLPGTHSEADSAPGGKAVETYRKVSTFLDRFSRWRRLVRQVSLSRCLETVLSETHYATWLLTQPRGAQRQANVQRLLTLTQDFDRFQRQGLFRFLKFIEAQQALETEPEVASSPAENAVRLMSIHQSKGLEFPVVVLPDLGKPFNLADLRADIILDEECGLCPQVKPPHAGQRYPSLPYWLARRRQRRELVGEELRLLYVAVTRARDTLILTGSLSEKRLDKLRLNRATPSLAARLAAGSFLDWIGQWFSLNAGAAASEARSGQTPLFQWFVHDQAELADWKNEVAATEVAESVEIDFGSADWRQVQERLAWEYPFAAATRQPAKTSVSALRRQAAADLEGDAFPAFPRRDEARARRGESAAAAISIVSGALSATEIGNAHHAFLQLASLEATESVSGLAGEATRLQKGGQLTPEQVAALDLKSVAHFWNSDLGRRIRAQSQFVRRELEFTVRFTPKELAALLGQTSGDELDGEFVLVQGVADLAVIGPDQIWVVDFKTDALERGDVQDRARSYEPQLRLYSRALSRIYRRPVEESWLYFLAPKTLVQVAL